MTVTRTTIYSHRMRGTALLAATALVGVLAAAHPAAAQDASSLAAIQAQITQLQTQLRTLQREAASRDVQLRRAQQDAAQARADAARAVSRRPTAVAAGGTVPGVAPNQVAGATGGSPAEQTQALQGTPQPGAGQAPGYVQLGGPQNPGATSLGGVAPPSIVSTAVDASSPTIRVGNVTLTLGGFIDISGLYRSSNLTSGISTGFNGIPFSNSLNAHTGETRFSAQHSRLSLLVNGKISPTVNVAGYFEGDLDGAATTSNSYQTNSYTPRVRQVYAQYDDSGNGLHFLAGQAYSLATGFTTGLTPRKESIPLVIDANYLPGYVYERGAQLRAVKDFGQNYHVGLSIEEPQASYSFTGGTLAAATTNAVTGTTLTGTLPKGTDGNTVLVFNTGNSYLNNTANYSTDLTPDLVLKASADPGYGHYEVFGIGRSFKTVSAKVLVPGAGGSGAGKDEVAFGGGIGGSTVIPIIPKYLDFSGNILAGYGIGRYLSGEIADATLGSNGQPKPLGEIGGTIGLVGHPIKPVDVYLYTGMEQVRRNTFSAGGATYGYGPSTANVSGCGTENLPSSTCGAQTRELENISVGAWWRFAHGPYGTLQAGAQYRLHAPHRVPRRRRQQPDHRRPRQHAESRRKRGVLHASLPALPVASDGRPSPRRGRPPGRRGVARIRSPVQNWGETGG